MRRKKSTRTTALILAGVVALAVLGYLPNWLHRDGWVDILMPSTTMADEGHGDVGFRARFIDVGQGDCELIECDGQFLLIDGGERGNEERVVRTLKALGVERLDFVVATHPHSDHIGGLAYGILAAFPVGTVIAPRISAENAPTTQTYEQFLRAVAVLAKAGTNAVYAAPGQEYQLGRAKITVLGPLREDGTSYNNDSVGLRVAFGACSVLLCGDAEQRAESDFVAQWGDGLRSNVLKAGHHGSRTSSTEEFLRAAAPQAAVISCGADNTYGHPNPAVLARFAALKIPVYRTDLEETIVFASDGAEIWREMGS
ncbi:MAG: MBL fold metallo-hydrolase [Oscillospiraceae bacterium]|jgi:beta-lactamase superfamily II metal-dependent hydrolase|nr:MBL fold metallo-hydrolase [Oscillospiraceae bacterium]